MQLRTPFECPASCGPDDHPALIDFRIRRYTASAGRRVLAPPPSTFNDARIGKAAHRMGRRHRLGQRRPQALHRERRRWRHAEGRTRRAGGEQVGTRGAPTWDDGKSPLAPAPSRHHPLTEAQPEPHQRHEGRLGLPAVPCALEYDIAPLRREGSSPLRLNHRSPLLADWYVGGSGTRCFKQKW